MKDTMEKMGACFTNFSDEAKECKKCLLAKACKNKTMDKELHEMTSHAITEKSLPKMSF